MWGFDFLSEWPLEYPGSFRELFGTMAIAHSNSRNGNLTQAKITKDLDNAAKHTAQ